MVIASVTVGGATEVVVVVVGFGEAVVLALVPEVVVGFGEAVVLTVVSEVVVGAAGS